MGLRDQLQADLEALAFNVDDFARVVTYRPVDGGAATTVRAVIMPGRGEEYRGSDAYDVRATLLVLASEVSTLSSGDVFEFDGDDWAVVSGERGVDGKVWRAQISRTAYA